MAAPLTTPDNVVAYLGLPSSAIVDVEPIVAAVISLVTSYHGAPADGAEWADHYKIGATMLAARIFRRRNSPAGVEALGDLGPVYVSRNDPDLAQLLKLGRYAEPRVG